MIGGLDTAYKELTRKEEVEAMNNAWHELMAKHTGPSGTDWGKLMEEWKMLESENYAWDSFRSLTPSDYNEAMNENDREASREEGYAPVSMQPVPPLMEKMRSPKKANGILDRTIDPRKKFKETLARRRATERISK